MNKPNPIIDYKNPLGRNKANCIHNFGVNYDFLTNLPNRTMLESYLSEMIRKSRPSMSVNNIAVMCLDLDRFNAVNFNLGHKAGDLLLIEVANRLKAQLINNQLLFKHGGDEFFIVIPNGTHHEITNMSRQILNGLASSFLIYGFELNTSASIGISMFPEHGQTAAHLICNAEAAKEEAKACGGNTFHLFSPKDDKGQLYNLLELERDLRKAIERNELVLHYQPKIDLKTGDIVGTEALLRWNHSRWGLISPADFIPLAEETGLIVPIGEWVIKTACKQNVEWSSQIQRLRVSVNLSMKQFTHSNLVQTVSRIIEEEAIDPQFLELEITESMMADINNTIPTLYALKQLGVRISIDDFGTGFSSLSYLSYFPVDVLKLDQSFVQGLYHNQNGKTIVQTIIAMAHNLNLEVVAEGIETIDQLQFMKDYHCNMGQGFYFSKPVSALEFEQKLSEF